MSSKRAPPSPVCDLRRSPPVTVSLDQGPQVGCTLPCPSAHCSVGLLAVLCRVQGYFPGGYPVAWLPITFRGLQPPPPGQHLRAGEASAKSCMRTQNPQISSLHGSGEGWFYWGSGPEGPEIHSCRSCLLGPSDFGAVVGWIWGFPFQASGYSSTGQSYPSGSFSDTRHSQR